MSKPMTNERLEELRQIAGGVGGKKSEWMDELIDEIDQLNTIIDKLRNAELSQCGWEDDEDIVLLNRKPVGMTISKRNRLNFDRWWPAVKAELLGEGE